MRNLATSAGRAATAALLALAIAVPASAQTPAPLIWESTLTGAGDTALRWPVAVASAVAGEIVIAEAFHPRLVVFRAAGGEWKAERSVPLAGAPVALAASGDRYLVGTRGPAALLALDRKGYALRPIPLPKGTIPGALAAAADGTALLRDESGEQVLSIAPGGGVTLRTPLAGLVRALAAAPGGSFYAVFPVTARVVRYTPEGTAADVWQVPGEDPVPAWPVALAPDAAGRILILDRHAGRIVILDARGRSIGAAARRGWEAGLLSLPSALALLPDGRVVVADQGNGRAQIFVRPEGRTP